MATVSWVRFKQGVRVEAAQLVERDMLVGQNMYETLGASGGTITLYLLEANKVVGIGEGSCFLEAERITGTALRERSGVNVCSPSVQVVV